MTEAEVNEIAGRIRFLSFHNWSGPSHETLAMLLHTDAPALVAEVRKLRRLLNSTIDALGSEFTFHGDAALQSALKAFKRDGDTVRPRAPRSPSSK